VGNIQNVEFVPSLRSVEPTNNSLHSDGVICHEPLCNSLEMATLISKQASRLESLFYLLTLCVPVAIVRTFCRH
jgi:hypothetical protein